MCKIYTPGPKSSDDNNDHNMQGIPLEPEPRALSWIPYFILHRTEETRFEAAFRDCDIDLFEVDFQYQNCFISRSILKYDIHKVTIYPISRWLEHIYIVFSYT